MDKRLVSRHLFKTISNELDFFQSKGIISSSQKSSMLSNYELKEKHNFIRIVLIVGAILLGAGILSFIASNWIYLSKLYKFLLIIFSIIGVNFIGYKLEMSLPKTSRALYYIGVISYGAGIFLVGQTFNLGGSFHSAFLLWSLGIVAIGLYLKDVIILTFSSFLMLIYSNMYYFSQGETLPTIAIIILPVFYYILKETNFSKLYTFFINLLSINIVTLILLRFIGNFKNGSLYILFIMFSLGIIMVFLPVKKDLRYITKLQGHLVHWIAGFMLTFSHLWGVLSHTSANIFWGIFYFIFALFLMNRGSLFSIAIVCSLILRFYIDISYDFLPKSLVFMIGGLILIIFGFYFERQRKKGEKI